MYAIISFSAIFESVLIGSCTLSLCDQLRSVAAVDSGSCAPGDLLWPLDTV